MIGNAAAVSGQSVEGLISIKLHCTFPDQTILTQIILMANLIHYIIRHHYYLLHCIKAPRKQQPC